MRRIVIGVMGAGDEASLADIELAGELGRHIALEGWVLLTGGRDVGVMDAASRVAQMAGGLTVGILPGQSDEGVSPGVDIAIFTDMGSARNNINVLSCDAIAVCGMGAGTAAEVALALKAGKSVVLLRQGVVCQQFFHELAPDRVFFADTPAEAIQKVKSILARRMPPSSDRPQHSHS